MKYSQKIISISVSALIFLSLLVGIEIISGFILKKCFPPELADYRKSNPGAYQHSPYYSKDFLKESFLQPGGWQVPSGTKIIIPNDFSGSYFHISEGMRRTAGHPLSYLATIYVFGGSTIYGSEVPDEYTLPSYLQKYMNSYFPQTYRVLNLGTTSVTSTQELERLRKTDIQKGDVVIFYNGVNDVFQGVYNGIERETISEFNNRIRKKYSFRDRIMEMLRRSSLTAKLISEFAHNREVPQHIQKRHVFRQKVRRTARQLRRNIREAHAFSQAKQARFFHFLQPSLFLEKHLSSSEKEILRNPNLFSPPGMQLAFRHSRRVFRRTQRQLQRRNISSHNLEDVFQERLLKGEDVYLDACHVNEIGNKLAAERMSHLMRGYL